MLLRIVFGLHPHPLTVDRFCGTQSLLHQYPSRAHPCPYLSYVELTLAAFQERKCREESADPAQYQFSSKIFGVLNSTMPKFREITSHREETTTPMDT